LIKGDFLLCAGDDYYPPGDFAKATSEPRAVVAGEVNDLTRFGVIEVKEGKLISFEEKPAHPKGNLACTSLYHLGEDFLFYLEKLPKSERGELELTGALPAYAQDKGLSVVESDGWIPIGYPWDLLTASEKVCVREQEGWLGDNVRIHPHAQVENCIIMRDVEIKERVRLTNSIIAPQTIIDAEVVIEDEPAQGKKTVFSIIKGRMVDTGRENFGCVLGDGVHIGRGARLASGVKIAPQVRIPPGAYVREDVPGDEQ